MKYKPGSVGTVIPNTEIKLVDPETGEIVGNNKEGEAYLRTPSMALGYFGLPEATKESFVDGWFKTGDLLLCDEDNYFFVKDRLKEWVGFRSFGFVAALTRF